MRRGAARLLALILVAALVGAGCERAGRFPPKPPSAAKITPKPESPTIPDFWGWGEMKDRPDIPISLVPASSPRELFWGLGPRSSQHQARWRFSWLGFPNHGSFASLLAVDGLEIQIHVPLGLPDPSPYLSRDNPLTYARWLLGKELFFEEMIRPVESERPLSCANCHQPKKRFSDQQALPIYMPQNTPTLINVFYNKHQFRDGRVQALEQVLVRELADEAPGTVEKFRRHIFGGLVKAMRQDSDNRYRQRFLNVFGNLPAQDTMAKALATYMRTILSGNSIFDRAQSQRGKNEPLTKEDFRQALRITPDDVEFLAQKKDKEALVLLAKKTKDEAAELLQQGYGLFTGKAGCAGCHSLNGLFTDQDFHNIGLSGLDELGRLAQVPAGLKEHRLRGAYRTASLRNLFFTKPYFHDGGKETLEDVVKHYNEDVLRHPTLDLAPTLRGPAGRIRQLNLKTEEVKALILFLRALEGGPVDPRVAEPPANSR